MRIVHVVRGEAEKTPVQIRDDSHLVELVQRFGAGAVIDAETGQAVELPAQPEAQPEPEPEDVPEAEAEAEATEGKPKRSKR